LWKACLHNLKQCIANNSLVCKYLQANLRFYANICKQIFDWMRNSLEVLQTIASKQIYISKYLPVWENVKQIFALKSMFASTCILHQIKYLYANLCKYFAASMKRAMGREIIVRGQSFFSRLPKYWPPIPLSARRVCTDRLAGRRGGWGVNILEDEKNRIALLQWSLYGAMWLNDVCKYWNIRIWSKEDPYSLRFASKLIKKLWI
jgi:hypothetical protein